MFQSANKDRWHSCEKTRMLENERALLMATQNTLHGMLSSLWDASCTCNVSGTISSSTPHLEQLLGGGEDLVGTNLAEFAAGGEDEKRIQDFMTNAASCAERQALSVQCSLQPQRCATSHLPYEVSMYAIQLPPGSDPQTNCSREGT